MWMLTSGLFPLQGGMAVAGVAPAEVVPWRWQAPVWGHTPQQLLGPDSGTLLQEVCVTFPNSTGPLLASPSGPFLLCSMGAALGVRAGLQACLVCAISTSEVRAGTGAEKLLTAPELQQSLDAGEEMGVWGSEVSAP